MTKKKCDGIIFSGVENLNYEGITYDITGNKYLILKIMTLPIQNDDVIKKIIEYIISNNDFRITIEKLED